ncbi:ABC transporter substrate-binding protein [Wenjunlia tyrosinilytica]|uniref:ABC transporter substrate-binding protein n=1 Tax=Wenjunlia tyrosinilytica TaxID=1544741 RepID=A0A918E182_9ACTN|nr:ABC transporter substrate-binding protein [Wenjunlia tyrosinilytica]GGP00477.1 hypothetical protein GCM10012280_69330 [Wenjunlia tyrosinilytica]
MRQIRLGTFSPSVLLEVARVTGRLDAAGLAVVELPVTSSPQQFADLFDGRLDAGLTNPDNVFAYRFVQENPLGRTGDVRILAALDRGLGLALFTGPGREQVEDIRGGTVGVDVRGSGFAFVAFELLARAGLRADEDYRVEAFGATPRRVRALLSGACVATVLNAGSDLVAEDAGARRRSPVTELGPYVGSVLTATGMGVERNRDALRDLASVLVATARHILRTPAPAEVSTAIAERLGLTGDAVERHLAILRDSATGLVGDGRLRMVELETVIELRRAHARGECPDAVAALAGGLLDETFLS